jgi:hypothetical protein
MQIIEVSMIGVRSSVLRLGRPGTPLRFQIFPMIHVAEPDFYACVADRLRRCDLILAEGIASSAPVSALTASYRLPVRLNRSGLVEQAIAYEQLGPPVRYPDMTAGEFAAGWHAVPLWQRALAVTIGPLAGLEMLALGSRRQLASHLELTDHEWHERLSDAGSLDDLMSLLGEQRDRLLMAEMHAVHLALRESPHTVGVVHGAEHVAPVVHGMRVVHGYTVQSAEWLTVFGF